MYLENKYSKWYFMIMYRAKNRILNDYTEKHHIRPRSLGGTNQKDNLVHLTFREHFLAHWLLTKFTIGEENRSMRYAFTMMRKGRNSLLNSWQHDRLKRAHREKSHSTITREKIGAIHRGKPKSAEHIEKLRDSHIGGSSNAQTWILTYPDREVTVNNLKKYCDENDLSYEKLVYPRRRKAYFVLARKVA